MKAWKKYSSDPKTLRSKPSHRVQGTAAKAWRLCFLKGKVKEEGLQTRYEWEIYNICINTVVSGLKEWNFSCVSPATKGNSIYTEKPLKLALLLRNHSDAEAQGVPPQTQSVKISSSKHHTFCPHPWGWFPLHMSNRSTMPFAPPSYAAIKLSSQNILFLYSKEIGFMWVFGEKIFSSFQDKYLFTQTNSLS